MMDYKNTKTPQQPLTLGEILASVLMLSAVCLLMILPSARAIWGALLTIAGQ